MPKPDKDDVNAHLWLMIAAIALFWLMQWADSRPVKLKPRENRPAATYYQR